MLDRKELYRFPWSKTDNPGGWIEVTDLCDMHCPGCYRSQMEGHRTLEAIYKDIDDTIRLINCDYITIAGGEPLSYPFILDVVRYIHSKKLKPMIISNGSLLTLELANQLEDAGLAKIHIHIDSVQPRKDWTGKTESELNELRQYYADLLWKTKIQCGFHVTIFRSNFEQIPAIISWTLKNIHKVQHISFIAYRAIVNDGKFQYIAQGKYLDPTEISSPDTTYYDVSITSEDMYNSLVAQFPNLHASSYLNGTAKFEINKFINIAVIGSKRKHYGVIGARTVELAEIFYHFFKRRYFAFMDSPVLGKKVFLASVFDNEVKLSHRNFLKSCLRNPLHLFEKIFVQSIHFQQPNEIDEGIINFCDDCPNMMVYNGKLINSCRLDEYRKYGEPMQVVKMNN